MRITGASGPWDVWHVPTCKRLKHVLWVDDETHQYAVGLQPYRMEGDGVAHLVVQARRIVALWDVKVTLIDPIEDAEPDLHAVPAEVSDAA